MRIFIHLNMVERKNQQTYKTINLTTSVKVNNACHEINCFCMCIYCSFRPDLIFKRNSINLFYVSISICYYCYMHIVVLSSAFLLPPLLVNIFFKILL